MRLSSSILLVMLLANTFVAVRIVSVQATGTIYIRADGSVEPSDAPIQHDGDLYTLTGSITTNADGIVVERDNMTLDGAGYAVECTGAGLYGIKLRERKNVTIRNVEVTSFYDGIFLDTSSCNNAIIGNNVHSNSHVGIYLIYACHNNTITENNASLNTRSGIELLGSSNNSVTQNDVFSNEFGVSISSWSNNNFLNNNRCFLNGEGMNFGGSTSFCTISFNSVLNNHLGVHVHDQSCNNTLIGNIIRSNEGGIHIVSNCTQNILTNNNVSANDYNGIHLDDSSRNTISGNNITNNWNGVSLHSSSNNSISGNNITTNNSNGICFEEYSNSNSIRRNNITNNGYYGIILSSSSINTISGNNIITNNRGVWLHSSSNNSISGNNITNSSFYHGVYLYSSYGNSIYGNNITNNGEGIRLSSSSNNVVYHNTFIDNIQQVHFYPLPSCPNVWDNGYPSGGNYWSDFAGVDLFSGLYQNETGGDGMGDTPYAADPNNTDRYPLMNPWPDVTSPMVGILSPQNTTYASSPVPLTFTVNEATSWVGYSLDNQANVTIAGNTTLNGPAIGPHNIILYANDTFGNMGSSDKVYFTRIVNDIAILNVRASPTETYVNQIVNVNVTVENKGTASETFNVTAYYDSNIIDIHTIVNLALGSNTTVTFSWNTSGVQKGTYTISAEAEVIPGETNTTDNTYIDNIVTILNRTPTIDTSYPSTDPTISEGESQEFHVTYSDPDGDFTTVQWYLNGTPTVTTDCYIFITGYASAGLYNVTVVASDGFSQASYQWTLTVTNLERDIAIIDVIASRNIVGEGYSVSINVTIADQGELAETFNVTVYANTTAIAALTKITLTNGNSTTIAFTWNTTGFTRGNYTVSAYVIPVQGETDIADNILTNGWVFVSIPGDINADRKVDLKDVYAVGKAFGTTRQGPNPPGRVYVPNCDINSDDKIDLKDYFMTCKNYGKSW